MSLEMTCNKCGEEIAHPANKDLVFMEGKNTNYPEVKILMQHYPTGNLDEGVYLIRGFWINDKEFPITEARLNMAACAPVSLTMTVLLRHLQIEIGEEGDEASRLQVQQ